MTDLEKRLREVHDNDKCSDHWQSEDCDGSCASMRELRTGARIALGSIKDILNEKAETKFYIHDRYALYDAVEYINELLKQVKNA